MGAFLFAAMSLVAVTMLLLLRPWQSRSTEHASAARELNIRVHRDQLAELDRDLAAGALAPADHAHSRDELQRRLLDDSALVQAPPAQLQRSRHTTLILALAMPLAASGIYAALGTPEALLARPATASAGPHQVTADEIDQMVAGLAARLEKNPADAKGWAMLARSYRALGRHAEAQAAFERIGDSLKQDPQLLAEYADALATQAGGKLEGKPVQLVTAALQIDPDHPMALSLAATAAYKRQDFAQAARHWQRLLKQLPPDSDDAKWLVKTLAEIGAPTTAAVPAAPAVAVVPANDAAPPSDAKSLSGIVRLAPDLAAKVRPTDTVFIFARAVDGSRMPLAVQRAKVSDLPLRFRLDDSSAMSPQSRLSGAARVRVEARVSRSGDATPTVGDPIGTSEPVMPGDARVALTIDRVR